MKQTTLCITTDIHGMVLAKSTVTQKTTFSGLARYSSALKNIRNTHNHVLVLDNGDTIQGTPLCTVAHKEMSDRINPIAQVFNHIGVDYFNIGNHDFNFGSTILFKFLHDLNARCITSNITYQNQPVGHSFIHTTPYGCKIGIIGVTTDYIPHWEQPQHIANFSFMDVIDTVKGEVEIIKPQVDVCIVLYHGGVERDFNTHQPIESLTGENVGYQLAQIQGIDVLMTGHQHRHFIASTQDTIVVQCSPNATSFAKIDLDFESKLTIKVTLEDMKDYEIDESIEELIVDVSEKTEIWLDQPLGLIQGPSLLIEDAFLARLYKHPLVSFINQVQMEVTAAQLSATSLFNEAIGFPASLTMRDLVSTYIYPNTLVVKKISGKTLKEYLEQCAQYFCWVNDIITVNPIYHTPKAQHFNYDMIDGITYTLDISKPIGQRLVDCLYKNQPIEDHDEFTIALNNYRAVGGGDFKMIADSATILDTQMELVDVIAEYIEKNNPVTLKHSDNIKIIPLDSESQKRGTI